MARVIAEIDELEIRRAIKEAQANKTMVPMDPWQLGRLVYGYFEFKKIRRHLEESGTRGGEAALVVARLAGHYEASRKIAEGTGVTPTPLFEHVREELLAYQAWAHDHAMSAPSDAGMRDSIDRELAELDTWNEWASGLLNAYCEPAAARAQIEARLADRANHRDECDWSKWAQKALGLSDAYVEEQKIGFEELRRMIQDRL